MHSTSNLEDGYAGSGRRLWLSINKHGLENHTKEILEFLESRQALKNREHQLVNEDILKDPMCMNLQPGGGGGICNDEHAKNLHSGASTWIKGKWSDPEYLKKMKKVTANRNKKNWKDPNYRKIMIESIIKGNKTRTVSEETRKAIGSKNSVHKQGIKNPMYGLCWMTHESLGNIVINKDDIETYILLGWKRGRKIIRQAITE